jgi:hypothetical protein
VISFKATRDKLASPLLLEGDILPIPPAAAKRLEQCGGVGVASRLRLDESYQSRLIRILGGEQNQVVDRAELKLAACDLQALGGGALRPDCGL